MKRTGYIMGTVIGAALILARPPVCLANWQNVPYDPATMSFPISTSQAITIAQNWDNDPSLSLAVTCVIQDTDNPGINGDPADPPAEYYDLKTTDGSLEFDVNCYSGEVWNYWDHAEEHSYIQSKNSGQTSTYTQAQMEQAALTFAQAHYPGFTALGMREESALFDDPTLSCEVQFLQPVSGAWFQGQHCVLGVNPYTGTVFHLLMWATSGPVNINTTPALTSDQAEEAAFSALMTQDSTLQSTFTSAPDELCILVDQMAAQDLVWYVHAVASTMPNDTYQNWLQNGGATGYAVDVFVDANTGAIVDTEAYLGAHVVKGPAAWRSHRKSRPPHLAQPSHKKPNRVRFNGKLLNSVLFPPVRRGTTMYWNLGYLRGGPWNFKVGRKGHEVLLTGKHNQQIRLKDGMSKIWLNGHAQAIASSPFVETGHTYVSLDAFQLITGSRFSWTEKPATLNIEVAGVYSARMGAREIPLASPRPGASP